MMMITITKTCKGYSPKEHYCQYDKEVKYCADLKDAISYLKNEYGNCRREKMYQDTKDGEAVHAGYIYCYNTPPCCYGDNAKRNQDWVSFYEYQAHIFNNGGDKL